MSAKWRSNWLFPLLLAAIMGGAGAWLDRVSEVKIENVPLNPDEPKYQMDNIHAERFDDSGSLKEQLTAKRAWQFPDSKAIHFAMPDLQLYSQGVPVYRVSSEEAQYDSDNRRVDFARNVVLTKQTTDTQPDGIVETEKLTVDTQNELAYTDAFVKYRYGLSHGTAQGLSYDHRRGFLNLPSRVKATIIRPGASGT